MRQARTWLESGVAMLWMVALIAVILWLLSQITGYTGGGMVNALLLVAIVAAVFAIVRSPKR